jgi:TM2 domain-containing membrane protein YozV
MKSRTTAALLALIFGVFGMHFFYLNRKGLGIMSVVFTMTGAFFVSGIIGFVNFLILLTMSDEEFDKRYNREIWREQKRRRMEGDYTEYDRNRDARERMRPTPQFTKPQPQAKPDISQKEVLKQNGLKKYKEFDYFKAIEDFGRALAIDNKDVSLHWNLSCLYSLTEQKELAFFHLQKAAELGFNDYEKIKTHDALAYLRVQSEFDEFSRNGFKMTENMEHSDILQQLKDLSEKRLQGLLTEREFAEQTRRVVEN